MAKYRVYVCHNISCKSLGSPAVWQALRREVSAQDADDAADLIVAGCQGRCDHGPNLTIHPGATKYGGVTAQDAPRIVRDHLLGDQVVDDLLFRGW